MQSTALFTNLRCICFGLCGLFLLTTAVKAQAPPRPLRPPVAEEQVSSAVQSAAEIPPGLVYIAQRIDLNQQLSPDEMVYSLDGEPVPDLKTTNVTIGVIINTEGFIVTRLANVPTADATPQLRVYLSGRQVREFSADFIGMDSVTGLCVLKIAPTQNIEAMKISALSAVDGTIGQRPVRIFGFHPHQGIGKPGSTILRPRIHAFAATIRKAADDFRYSNSNPIYHIATQKPLAATQDCSLVVEKDGSVFGLTAYDTSGDEQHLVYPLARVQRLSALIIQDSLQAKRRIVPHAWLGATSGVMPASMGQRKPEPPENRGILIAQVFPDSPADIAGVKPSDILMSISGRLISTGRDLRDTLQMLPADSEVTLKVRRNKEFKTFLAKLAPAPQDHYGYIEDKLAGYNQAVETLPVNDPKRSEIEKKRDTVTGILNGIMNAAPPGVHLNIRYGLGVLPLTAQLAKHFAAPSGVLVTAFGKRAQTDIKVGDVIVKIGEQPVADEASLLQALNEAKEQTVEVLLIREGKALPIRMAK